MTKTVKIVIELEYSQDAMGIGNFGNEYLSDDEYLDYVKDRVHEDIFEMMRIEDVEQWATVTMEGE